MAPKRSYHNTMAYDLGEIIYPDSDTFGDIKTFVEGAYLTPAAVRRIKNIPTLLTELEKEGHIGLGDYVVLRTILESIKYRRKDVLDIIDECTKKYEENPQVMSSNVSSSLEQTVTRPSASNSEPITINKAETVIISQNTYVAATELIIPKSLQEFIKSFTTECARFATEEFVETKGAEKCLSLVTTKRIVMIIGLPGAGKSSIAMWLVSKLCLHEYEVMVVGSVDDWRNYVDPTRKQIVVIEDIFGTSQFDLEKCKAWLGRTLEIELAIKRGFLYVVITCGKMMHTEAKIHMSKLVFQHAVDLTTEQYKLTVREKKDILVLHMAINKRKLPEIIKEESFTFLENDIIGFPECCRIFAAEDSFQEKGIDIFTDPSIYLKKLLIFMSTNMCEKFSALVYCMLHGGEIPQKCCEVTNKCPKYEIAMISCGLKGDQPLRKIVQQMDVFVNSLLLPGDNEIAFKLHQTLLNAIVEVFCNDCRGYEVILRHADLVFISNNDRICKDINENHFGQLWNRMINELTKTNFLNLVLGSLLLKYEDFVFFYTNRLMNNNELISFLSLRKYFLLKSNLREHSTEIVSKNNTLLNAITNSDVVEYILKCPAQCSKRKEILSYILLWSTFVNNNHEVSLKLLSNDLNRSIKSIDGITPIHCAAIHERSAETVRALLIAKLPQTATENGKNTPLHIAASFGRDDTIFVLLAFGAKLDAINSESYSALHMAAQNDNTKTARLLLDNGANVDAEDMNRNTPLHWASLNGYMKTARLLLIHGANYSAEGDCSYTPLHWASQNGNLDTTILLLMSDAKPDVKDKWGNTPLHRACEFGHTVTVLILLDKGADKYAVQEDNCTPLHIASQNGHLNTTRLLLERDAKHDVKDKWGNTPLHKACQFGHTDTVQILLDNGADKAAVQMDNYTPLHWTSQNGHLNTTRLLLERGTQHDVKDKWGNTPLHRACQFGHTETVRLLLDNGADKYVVQEDKCTPLHWASQEGRLNTVRLLLERGCSPTLFDKWGLTPLDRAKRFHHIDIIQLLQAYT